jgi:hypothetical protein
MRWSMLVEFGESHERDGIELRRIGEDGDPVARVRTNADFVAASS